MATIDRDLVRAINSGRAFALVGAGPSCELGVPSWENLAQRVVDKLQSVGNAGVASQCRTYISRQNYAYVFSLGEKELGTKELMALLDDALSGTNQNGRLYRYISSWPFANYLTTNFDDHLSHYLNTECVNRFGTTLFGIY